MNEYILSRGTFMFMTLMHLFVSLKSNCCKHKWQMQNMSGCNWLGSPHFYLTPCPPRGSHTTCNSLAMSF